LHFIEHLKLDRKLTNRLSNSWLFNVTR